MLAPRPTPKLDDHPSSAVRGCLFNLFTATLHIGGRSFIRNPRTRHAVVTGTHIHGTKKLHETKVSRKCKSVSCVLRPPTYNRHFHPCQRYKTGAPVDDYNKFKVRFSPVLPGLRKCIDFGKVPRFRPCNLLLPGIC